MSESTYPDRRPRLVAPGHALGYVANRASDTVSVLDLDAMTELGRFPIGRDPVDNDGPRHVSVDARSGVGYVVLSYPASAPSPHVAAKGATARSGYAVEFALDDGRPLGAARLEPSSTESALSDDGSLLAVVHYDTALALANTTDIDARRASLALIEPAPALADGTATSSSVKVCIAPSAVVLSPDATRAFVACTGEDSLAVVDTRVPAVTERVPAGPETTNKPIALARNAGGTLLAVSNQISREIVLFEVAESVSERLSVGLSGIPTFAAWLGDSLLVPTQDPSGAVLLDPTTGAVLTTATYGDDACRAPSDAHVTASGRVFLVCEGDHFRPGAVVELDPQSLAVTARVEVGPYPDRLAVVAP